MKYYRLLVFQKHTQSVKEKYYFYQIQRFEHILNNCDKLLTNYNSVLEFGCGGGRLIQHIINLISETETHGCDVLKKCIAQCKRKYPKGHFVRNDCGTG